MGILFFPFFVVSCILGRMALSFQSRLKQASRQKGISWGRRCGLSKVDGCPVYPSVFPTCGEWLFSHSPAYPAQCKEPNAPVEESPNNSISEMGWKMSSSWWLHLRHGPCMSMKTSLMRQFSSSAPRRSLCSLTKQGLGFHSGVGALPSCFSVPLQLWLL